MTKNDLAKIYVKNGFSKSVADGCQQIDNFINATKECLQTGEKLTLHGYLSMQIVDKPSQVFTDPKTKESRVLDAKKRIKISQTPGFRKLVGD